MAKKEDTQQIAFINWLKEKYPGVVCYSNLSGIRLSSWSLRTKASQLQTHKGQADLVAFEVRGGYGGWVFEAKRSHAEFLYANGSGFKPGDKNRIWSQVAMLRLLTEKGYCCDIGTLEEGKRFFEWYMNLQRFNPRSWEGMATMLNPCELWQPKYPHSNIDRYGEGTNSVNHATEKFLPKFPHPDIDRYGREMR